jgi:hypothetical protein
MPVGSSQEILNRAEELAVFDLHHLMQRLKLCSLLVIQNRPDF